MKRKKTIFSFLLVGFMVASLLTANLTRGIVVTDQLEIPDGTYTEGKLLYTNAPSTYDQLWGYATLKVDRIFTPTEIPDKVIQISQEIEIVHETYNLINYYINETSVYYTFYVFYDNRTTFLMPRIFLANDTESVEVSLLEETTYAGMMETNNTRVTFKNGTSYKYGDVLLSDPVYAEINSLAFLLWAFGGMLSNQFMYTPFGISPTANVGDNINYLGDYGEVISKPAVIATDGKSYDTILVRYSSTAVMGFWTTEVDVYYEAATGFPLRIMEKVGSEHVEFVPGEFKSGAGIPFSTTGIILGFIAIGLITIIRKKKK